MRLTAHEAGICGQFLTETMWTANWHGKVALLFQISPCLLCNPGLESISLNHQRGSENASL